MSDRNRLSTLLKIGLLASLAAALMLTAQVPCPGAPGLKYDPSEVPVLIGGFALGPLAGVAILVLKNLLYLLLRFEPGELVGIPMNTLAGAPLVLVSAGFYQLKKTRARAVVGLVLGSLAMTAVMIPANLLVYPWFFHWITGSPLSAQDLTGYVLVVITPFNVVKATLTCTVTFLVYKRFSVFLKQEEASWGRDPRALSR